MSDGPHLGKEIAYVNGDLHVEHVDLKTLAKDPDVLTPAYIYSLALMRRRYNEFMTAMREVDPEALVCFAVKSLSNQSVLREFAKMEAGADLVTGGELERALRAGFDGKKIVFSGLGKTLEDIERAIAANVQINVESVPELRIVNDCARSQRARVAIRLNPQLEAMRGNLGQITTGKPDSKFGIPWKTVEELLPEFVNAFPHIDLVGVSVHVGSNMEVEGVGKQSFEETFKFLTEKVLVKLLDAGIPRPIVLDLGGGVGIDYSQTPQEQHLAGNLSNRSLMPYKELVKGCLGELVRRRQVRLVFEPGRFLSGEAGVLMTKVLYVKKETENRTRARNGRDAFEIRFLIVDAGMNDLMRPSLYGAYHHIVPVGYADPDIDNVDICGPVCETTDSFMRPTREWLKRYDTLFIGSAVQADNEEARKTRTLEATASTFGEVEPLFKDTSDRRTYEYFMKRRFPASIGQGDLLAILNAGAYGAVMSSEYNSRPLIPEVLVDKNRYAVIRKRPTYEELIGRDCTPVWKG
ncbi:MAG: diaminopimelate decarboxylase [Acidobacteriota bacterium]